MTNTIDVAILSLHRHQMATLLGITPGVVPQMGVLVSYRHPLAMTQF